MKIKHLLMAVPKWIALWWERKHVQALPHASRAMFFMDKTLRENNVRFKKSRRANCVLYRVKVR
jgi:hypothetical protein